VGTGLGPQAALTPGIITTIAGNGTKGFGGDGGSATAAELNQPYEAKFDGTGDLYFTDSLNYRVRKVDRKGIITTVAGNGTLGFSGFGGPATSASLGPVFGLAVDAAGNIYFGNFGAGSGYCVFKVDLNGILTIFAGTGTGGYSGDGGPATQAELSDAYGLAADAAGNLYIADGEDMRVRKVDTNGIITTIAGNGHYGFSGDGGPATQAEIATPLAVAVDAAGNLYIADSYNGRIRKVDAQGIITTFAGGGSSGLGDGGPATQAELSYPSGVAVDAAGNIYISDTGNFRIRRVDTNGTIKTVAGNGNYNYGGDGSPAGQAGMFVRGMVIDPSGGFYVADTYNNRVRKIDVSQSAVNFASRVVGTVSSSQEAVVTNTGNQHIEFTGLSLTGDFGQLTGTARDCTDTTFLGAGYSCALRITFAPTTAGSLTGSATVTDNSLSLPGTTQTISLTGTGVNP
jgi:sugar lactone lactonase YvrE